MIIKKQHISFYNINTNDSYNTLQALPKKWQLILFSDGSLTQNLNSIIGQTVRIDLIKQNLMNSKKIIRNVWIEDLNKNKLAFAKSYFITNYITKANSLNEIPIGKSIINHELDISKTIHRIQYGYNYSIEKQTNTRMPILSREYKMYYKQQSFNTIKEFFLPNFIDILTHIF